MDRKIIDYLPPVLRDIKEYSLILNTEQFELSDLWTLIEDALNDQFVTSSGYKGVKRWEDILNIQAKATDALDERQFRILARLQEQLPYTVKSLKQQIHTLCNSDDYSVEFDNFTLTVKIGLINKKNFNEVGEMLKRIVPANMIVEMKLIYNQYSKLSQFTYRQLKQFTYKQLREEVLS